MTFLRPFIHPGILALMAPIDALAESQRRETRSDFPEEAQASARFAPVRRREFMAGRELARQALTELGIAPCPIPRMADRSPRWPDGVRGSITHVKDWVAVAVSADSRLRAVGIDLEGVGAFDVANTGQILASREESALDPTVLFSLKESVFKAVNPLCGEFLDFGDVTISTAGADGVFHARGRPGLVSSDMIAKGRGMLISVPGHHLTAFIIDA